MEDKEDQYFNKRTKKKEMAANLKHGELLFDTLKLKLQYSVLQIIETI
jgi:hypothetical protein